MLRELTPRALLEWVAFDRLEAEDARRARAEVEAEQAALEALEEAKSSVG